eukprot:gene57825-77171_t
MTVGGCKLKLSVKDNVVMIEDEAGGVAKVTIADVKQSNGVIHVIDKGFPLEKWNHAMPIPRPKLSGRLIKRQKLATRITHWLWAICLFFLLLSGLQIFNAHPALYLGDQSGFSYDNAIFAFEGFPSWMTIPSTQDLATGRV